MENGELNSVLSFKLAFFLFLDRMDGNSVTVLNILEEPEKNPKELTDVVKKLRIIITGLKGSHMNEDGSKVIKKKMCK